MFTGLSMENFTADSLPFGMTELTKASIATIHADSVDLFQLVSVEKAGLQSCFHV